MILYQKIDGSDVNNQNWATGIPRFTLLMWGHTKKRGSKNRVN